MIFFECNLKHNWEPSYHIKIRELRADILHKQTVFFHDHRQCLSSFFFRFALSLCLCLPVHILEKNVFVQRIPIARTWSKRLVSKPRFACKHKHTQTFKSPTFQKVFLVSTAQVCFFTRVCVCAYMSVCVHICTCTRVLVCISVYC